MKLKNILIPTLALFLICGITTAALSITNYFTKDKIEATRQQAIDDSMEQLVPGGEFTPLNEQKTAYSATAKEGTQYILLTSAMGYKSQVEVMTSLDPTGQITGVIVTNCSNESPGIGQKVGDDKEGKTLRDQFIGRTEQSDQVDAITGATISSKAVNQAINQAVQQFQELKQGGVIHEK